MLEFEPLCALDTNVLPEPLLVAIELRGGGKRAVGHHRKQRPLDVELEPPAAEYLTDHLAHAEAAPEVLQHIEIPVAVGLDELPDRVLSDDFLGGATAENAVRKPPQPLGRLAILGAATVVDDLDLRALVLRVPEVLGQLQVGEHRAVSALLPRFAQIHVSNDTRVLCSNKALSHQPMYLGYFARTGRVPRITH